MSCFAVFAGGLIEKLVVPVSRFCIRFVGRQPKIRSGLIKILRSDIWWSMIIIIADPEFSLGNSKLGKPSVYYNRGGVVFVFVIFVSVFQFLFFIFRNQRRCRWGVHVLELAIYTVG